MTSISTRASFGRRATCTVARAGNGSREVLSVDLVHRGEVVHVGEEDRRAHDVGERQAAGLRAPRRCCRATRRVCAAMSPLDDLAGGRIERHLSRDEQQLAGANRLGIGPIAFGASGLETTSFMESGCATGARVRRL